MVKSFAKPFLQGTYLAAYAIEITTVSKIVRQFPSTLSAIERSASHYTPDLPAPLATPLEATCANRVGNGIIVSMLSSI